MAVIEVRGLTKRFGPVLAVDQLSFDVDRGTVVGFLGPNGAGKTTTLRTLLGLVRPTSGSATINGKLYSELADPARHVGAVLEASSFYPGRRARDHLRVQAMAGGIEAARVEAVLKLVGLQEAAGRRVGGFSLGMRQRLGLAAALVGAPDLLVLDEPTDGVDPLGRAEIRQLLARELARGATLFINSHLLSETERICTRIGILSRGRLVRSGPLDVLTAVQQRWRVRFAPGAPVAADALVALGFEPAQDGAWEIPAPDAATLNRALDRARSAGALLIELERASRDLEDVLTEALAAGAA